MSTVSAWVAGIVDGEGSIYCSGLPRKYVSVTLRICMTSRKLIQYIHKNFGGTIYTRDRRAPWKRQYDLVWSGSDVLPVLLKIRRHLRLKGPQADLACRILALPNGHSQKTILARRIKRLNHRGTHA